MLDLPRPGRAGKLGGVQYILLTIKLLKNEDIPSVIPAGVGELVLRAGGKEKCPCITEEGFVYEMPYGSNVTEYYQSDFQIIKY